MMVLTHFVTGVLAVLAGTAGVHAARADVYIWSDASGRMNVSNLTPPEGAHVMNVIPSPPKDPAREQAAQEAARRAEIQALNDRVARLQDDLDRSRRDAAMAPVYTMPPPMAYAPPPSWAPPAPSYVMDAPPPQAMVCDAPWIGCGIGWWGGWPYANVVVLGGKPGRHFGPGHGMRPGIPRPHGPFRPHGVSRRS